MTDDELNQELVATDLLNNNITGALTDIAHKRAAIQLGLEDDTDLGFYQSFVAKFCGEKF